MSAASGLNVEHRFENFSDDLSARDVLQGAEGGEKSAEDL
jgi:hypothetical protein